MSLWLHVGVCMYLCAHGCTHAGDLKREKDLWQQAAYKLANKAGALYVSF